MGMEFRHLRCFLVLADELHFGRAAQRLAMTQPPLSLNIRQLEEALGARLFDRDSKGVRLTAAGQAFRDSAQALVSLAEGARQRVREVAAGAAGQLRIGFVGSVLFRGLPRWLDAYRTQHPRVEVHLAELNSQDQIDALVRDELDLGFVHTRRVHESLSVEPVHAEPFLCCLPTRHRLARRPAVAIAELRDEPFVLFSRRSSPDYHARIVAMCAEHGFEPRLQHEARHWLSVVSLVAHGLGVSVVPAALQETGIAGAVFRPFAEPTRPSEVVAVWRCERELPARGHLLEIVRQDRG